MTKFTLSQYKNAGCPLLKVLGENSTTDVLQSTHGNMCPFCKDYGLGGSCKASKKLNGDPDEQQL